MTGDLDPKALVEGLNEELRSQWIAHRRQAFNTSTKGSAYETTLQKFLTRYFSGVYDIRTNSVMIDPGLEVFDIFNSGDAEFDVVSTFHQAVPGLIFESEGMNWVAYDSVAFVCEVKSKLTKSSLESDLEKFAKLKKLDSGESVGQRFPRESGITRLIIEGDKQEKQRVGVGHQLKCLVYDEEAIQLETLYNTLEEFTDIWDLVLVADPGVLIVSPELPFSEIWKKRLSHPNPESSENSISIDEIFPDIIALPDGLIWFLLLLTISIPRPRAFDVSPALIKLVQRDWDEYSPYYNGLQIAWGEFQ